MSAISTKISALTEATAAQPTDVVPVVRSGGNRRVTAAQIAGLITPILSAANYASLQAAVAAAIAADTMVGIASSLTVRVPTDAATIQIALDRLLPLSPDVAITLQIAAGHAPAVGVAVYGGDYGQFTITSIDAEVTVSAAFPITADFVFGQNARLPVLGCLVNMNGRGRAGYYARLNARGVVLSGCGVKNLGQLGSFGAQAPGIFANAHSSVYAFECVSINNPRNVWVSRGSNFDGEFGQFDGATGDIAVYVSRNSTLHIPASTVTNAANSAVTMRRSRAVLDACDLSGAGTVGLQLERTSQVSMTSRAGTRPKINASGSDALLVIEGSTMHFDDGEILNAGRDAVSVSQSALCEVGASTITGAVRYGATCRGSSGLTFNVCTITGSVVANLFPAEGGVITLNETTTDEGVRTETMMGSRVKDRLVVMPGAATDYGRFVVERTGANVGGTEYSCTDLEVRWLTDGARRARLMNSGTLRPEVNNTQFLGTTDFRWSRLYATQIRPNIGDVIWTSGTGSPEGVLAARVGSFYTREDGGAGTTLYVKESGAGNTGWVAK